MAAGFTASVSARRVIVALGAARDGAGEVQVRGASAAAGQHEGIERRQLGVHAIDLVLQTLDLGVDDAQAILGAFTFRCAQIGAEIEQIVLDARQHLVGVALGMQAHDADGGVGFVDRAERRDSLVVLGHALAGAERGRALVAALGVDACQTHHVSAR